MTTVLRDLQISGPFDPEDIFIERIKGTEALSAPFEFEITVLSRSPELDLSKLISETVTVTLAVQGGAERYFNGYVTKAAVVDTLDRFARYRLKVRPFVWLMSPRINCRIFQNKSVPEMVKELFREHGFSDIEDALVDDYPPRQYTVQYSESDFAFVSRLLEGAGISYYFKHHRDHHSLVLADAESAYTTISGYAEVPFHPASTARAPTAPECIESWVLEQQVCSGAFASDDFDFERPKAELLAKRISDSQRKRDQLEVYEYPGGFDNHDTAEVVVRTRLQEVRREVETVTAAGDVRGLGAGNMFQLTKYQVQSQNKSYLVTTAHFEASVGAPESGDSDAAMQFKMTFGALDSRIPYRPARLTPVPRIEGPQTAIVVGKKGEEIWTDQYGRVKVQFHWDREGGNDEKSSCWVRVAQVWTGGQWGAIHIPRVGQEVVVAFLDGDPDRPIVVGRVYNRDNMVPYDLPANMTRSGIKSRSTMGGGSSNFNELRFEDKKGAEEVFLQAEMNLEILVKHDEHRSVGHDRRKDVTNDEMTSVGGSRTESVTKNESVSIGANRTESVGMNETVSIAGNRGHSVDKDETVSVAGARSLSVGKDDSKTIAGSGSVDVAKNLSLSVGKDESITVGGKRIVDVGKDLLVSAGHEIVLKTGDASITLKKNGDITIKGKNIVFDGSGKIAVKASGEVNISGSKVTEN